jgi:subtilisin family serine protease
MTRGFRQFAVVVAALLSGAASAAAEQRFIVRTAPILDGIRTIDTLCGIVGCTRRYALDGGLNQLFLVTTTDAVVPNAFLQLLSSQPGVVNAEFDVVIKTLRQTSSSPPPALADRQAVGFFGSTVWQGYLTQPAAQLLRIDQARGQFGLTGRNVIVALIDTGVDPHHPVLMSALVSGYDFTRNIASGFECDDLDPSVDPHTRTVPEDSSSWMVNQSTMAVVDQSTMAVVDVPSRAGFGHGTMVAGIIHLVAPEALIMPLKAFGADGSGYTSDILRAIHHAVRNGAKVLNMSFGYPSRSREMDRAVTFAMSRGLLAVASAGNDGLYVPAYPAALQGVIGVASSTDADTLSRFSNYGEDYYWIAAPGEEIVTTYPFRTYAAATGTSFAAAFATGAAALLAESNPDLVQQMFGATLGNAVPLLGVARGRLDIFSAVQSQQSMSGQ